MVLVLLKLIASMIEAYVVSEVNLKCLKLFWTILQMMFKFAAEFVVVDGCLKLCGFQDGCKQMQRLTCVINYEAK